MKRRKTRRLAPLMVAAIVASPPLLAGCAALASRDAPATAPMAHRSATGRIAIAQVRIGNTTRFELCAADACPKPTPKTPATRTQARAAPSPPAASFAQPSGIASSDAPPAAMMPRVAVASDAPALPAVASKSIAVTFASGSAVLTAAAQRDLAAILPAARRSPVIEIRGRTDERGSVALNDRLARDRALAVRDYLRAQDLPEAVSIRLTFKGACCYVAENDTKEGRAANRRVEIEYRPSMQLARGAPA